MRKIGQLFVLVLAVSFPSFAAGKHVIKYEGSSTVGRFMMDAKEVYKKDSIEIISVLTESNGGEICALAKTCNLGGVARDNIHPLFIERGVHALPFAYDVLTAIVNSENPVKSVTSDQLKDIFSGKIKNWKKVGGEDLPINVYIVGKESATRDVFKKNILKDKEYSVDSQTIRPDKIVPLMVDMDEGGIGQISYSFVANNDHVRPLIIDGYNAVDFRSEYPIRRLLQFTTYGIPHGSVKEFLQWVFSEEGRQVIKKRFLPLQ